MVIQNHIIRREIKESNVIYKQLVNSSRDKSPTRNKVKKIYLTFSYYGHESIILENKIQILCKNLLPNITINIAYKKYMTLRNIFLPIQKGIGETRKNKKLVYIIDCKNCDKKYIGETNRNIQTRMKEHRYDIRKNKITSQIAQDCNTNKHMMDIDNVKTLTLESMWKRRIIKGSIYTHYTQDKAINEVKYKLKLIY
ncbi:unnamed protein product [Adineta steineri]|uniref:GIY-YIG domain-containing protein n=1 Tax=Adineta steineri TaxID=433720 RepID=A0A815ICV7_9BILA|nr:unnamed protein product [Adineta steineri]CAF1601033.1 unnamed protein product [Adineta steineri]